MAAADAPVTQAQDLRRSERVERRRRQILDAAARVMQRTGYHGMSIQLLAEEADISVGLVYQYFGGKHEVLQAVIEDILSDFQRLLPDRIAAAGDDPRQRLVSAVRAYCEIIGAKRDAAVLAYRESPTLDREGRDRIKDLERQTVEPIRLIVENGLAAGVFRRIDPALVAHTVLMVAHGWALKHWNLAPRMSLDDYIRQETDLLLRGLAADPEPGPSATDAAAPTIEEPTP